VSQARTAAPPISLLGTDDEPRPLVVIRPSTGWGGFRLRELWDYRDLLMVLGGRDVKLRYRQTALGIVWVIFQPLVGAAIFALVFGRVARLPSEGVPYFLFAYAGYLGWNAFQSTLSKASMCLVQSSHLVSKVFFPRVILPLSTHFSTLLDYTVGLAFLIVLWFVYGVFPGPALLLLPLWMLLMQCLALGVGFYASALTVRYRDVQHALPVLMQFVLYASPVAYATAAVPESLRPFYALNPITGLLEAFRWSLVGHTSLDWTHVAYAAVASLVVFAVGALSFKRMERQFADVI
jgi:lipopolysaccharide transport system permease protein